MEKVQTKGNKQDNQNSISNGGVISKMIMESPLMQQREREHNEMFGEASQLMAKDSNAPIQRLKSQVGGAGEIKVHNALPSLATKFNLELAGIKDDLFNKFKTNARIPDTYMDNASRAPSLQKEVLSILNKLVKDSGDTITANSGDSVTFINQLYTAVSPLITEDFVANYPYLQKAVVLNDRYANYATKLGTIEKSLNRYDKQKKIASGEQAGDNGFQYNPLKAKQFETLIDKLQPKFNELKQSLEDALNLNNDVDINRVLEEIDTLANEIPAVEVLWKGFIELDYRFEDENITGKLDTFIEDNSDNERVANHYADDGGVDDGRNVGDEYDKTLACSLYAILAVKPGWLGADTPEKLHDILRRTNDLKDYDDNKKAAYVRYLAGLTPTAQNQTLGEYIDGRGADRSSFIVDPTDIAHTFAVVYKGDAGYKRYDNDLALGGPGGIINRDINLVAIWK